MYSQAQVGYFPIVWHINYHFNCQVLLYANIRHYMQGGGAVLSMVRLLEGKNDYSGYDRLVL